MNVYDFDKTVYNGDSSIDFFLYAIRKKPSLVRYLPKQINGFFLYAIKKIDKTRLKEYFFSFLRGVDAATLAGEFWQRSKHKIFGWYLAEKVADDVIISASPEFLLRPICDMLAVKCLIASRVDMKTGTFVGKNCHGDEKVQRLGETLGAVEIERFYSDSPSDLPLARHAKKAFLVKNGKVTPWIIKE